MGNCCCLWSNVKTSLLNFDVKSTTLSQLVLFKDSCCSRVLAQGAIVGLSSLGIKSPYNYLSSTWALILKQLVSN